MRFLLDVHIATSIARALSNKGHDVIRAALAHSDWADDRLLALAVAEERVLVTQDSDFSDLIFARSAPPPPAILYLQCAPQDQPKMAGRVIETLETDRVDGHIVVIRPASTRYRPLPGMSK